MALTIALPGHTMMDGAIEDTCQMTSVMTGARDWRLNEASHGETMRPPPVADGPGEFQRCGHLANACEATPETASLSFFRSFPVVVGHSHADQWLRLRTSSMKFHINAM